MTCTSDVPQLNFMYSSQFNFRGSRVKCTFSNIQSIETMKNLVQDNSRQYPTTNIVSIAFNQSNLAEFPDRTFSLFQNLRSLDASNLNLISISSSAFSGLTSLDVIDLSFNNLTSLPGKVFANRKLKFLDLSYNLISTIDDAAFSGSEIDKINLSFNKIKSTTFINGFKSFILMQLNDNQIENFDKVEIARDNWNTQREIFYVLQYPSINLQNNKIKNFDCSSTMKFVLIDLENNLELKEVKLNDCEINQFDVTNCMNLKKIRLSDKVNGFTAKNVKFDEINFGTSKSLTSLVLTNNSLSSQTIDNIMKLENLTTLDLSFNTIGSLNVSTFAKLKNLITLKLKATQISDIKFGTFSHQTGVRTLDISDNNLGYFDMQMIFSMNSLTTLDISGNDLKELKNIESAHSTFASLEKIDLTNNKWTCKYLMRLMRIMQAYRVNLVHSSIEEHQSNIHGIYCLHIDGDDSYIAPLMPDATNITEFRDKLNELVSEISKMTSQRMSFDERLRAIEKRVDEKLNIFTTSEALKATKIDQVEVKNGALLEFALIIVCCCFTIFMIMKMFVFVKNNLLNKPKPMRVGLSQNTLTIDDDY
ncbi:hypothetical protein PVAND_009433 [Polypedilum vanderplanki]|uniref:Uncharacterized protein n=1 Tax=Polypedilum vanderplanki TaxID=319348 RepID=A0A9J6CCK4_POLVA|nr:hypothetical protein PVAND_009433 [Polypedilum vanderplanki]